MMARSSSSLSLRSTPDTGRSFPDYGKIVARLCHHGPEVSLRPFLLVGFLALASALTTLSVSAAIVSEAPRPEDALPREILVLQRAAEEGSAKAAVDLGKLYAEGRGVRPNLSESEKWLRKALESREPGAYRPLALLLLRTSNQGEDVERVAEGLSILRAAADTDPGCAISLGQLHARGQFVKQDFAEAERRFQAAADAGASAGWYWLGWLLSGDSGFPDRADPARAESSLEKAFDEGNIEAGRLLVKLLREGAHRPKDEAKAFRIVAAAAEKGSSEAQFFLGELYEKGGGVTADLSQALAAYRKAAEAGNLKAQNKLGLLHIQGAAGLEADPEVAQQWFVKAAEKGFAPAHLNLAIILAEEAEYGTEAAKRAIDHLVVAASAGMPDAQDRLGSWYRDGKLVPRDLVAASGWFRPAANAGNLSAKINLAQILEANIRNIEDLKTALGLYADASAAGHPVAHFHVARLLVSGITGQIDLPRAHAHLSVAAKAGFPLAAQNLPTVAEKLTDEQLAASEEMQAKLSSLKWSAAAPAASAPQAETSPAPPIP